MKGEFYKMDYEAWDEGTDELSLEQEAAYLRLCHQLYRRKAAIPSAPATLARIWRCHPNKARKLLADLVAAGKVVEADGHLTNTRVTRELDERETRRTQKADAGHTGGTQTQENRRKALKTNDADAADAGTPDKQNQAEGEKEGEGEKKEQIEATPQSVGQVDDGWPSNAFDLFWSEYPSKVAKEPARKSFATVRKSRRVTFDAMMAGLRRYIATKPPTRDWMHPTTWLNQGRWSDQPAPSSLVRPAPVGGRAPSHQDHFLRLAAEGHHELTGGDDGSDPFHDDVGPLFGTGGQGNGFGGAAPVVRDAGVRQLPPRRDPRSLGPH